MKQVYLELNSFHFYKDNDYLILTDSFSKTWFPVNSIDKYKIGLHEISANQLNQVKITFQDKLRLQCVVFHLNDAVNYDYGSAEYIKKQLEEMTGLSVVFKRNYSWLGRIKNLYIPLKDNLTYKNLYLAFDQLRDFKVGENITSITFQNGSPMNLSKDIETLWITESYLEDLEFLNDLPNLKSLIIERSVILNPNALASMNQLTHLYLETLDIPDSALFTELNKLTSLGIIDCDLSEVDGLNGKASLHYCDISGNRIEDITPLFDSIDLQWLACEDTLIEELDVSAWKQLKILEMSSCGSSDLRNLEQCSDLKILDYSNTELNEEALIEIEYLVEEKNLFGFDQYDDIEPVDCPSNSDLLISLLSSE